MAADRLQRMKQQVDRYIDDAKNQLTTLSHGIWSCPELAYQERHAHDSLVSFFLEDKGWTVERNFKIETAFRATWVSDGKTVDSEVLNVGFLCEYDALPGIGHACGHNLIAEVGAAAAIGLKGAVESESISPVSVKVTVLGTPAEEDGGGKIDLIQAGAFENMDVVFMAHPAQENVAFHPCTALNECLVKYHGKACHAAAYPWEGLNALDAAVLAYNNLSVLRQQLRPDWRLHGIIKHGGTKPNIIPDYTELAYYLRTPLRRDLPELQAKAEACFRAAATATGCEVEITYPTHPYSNILSNSTLERLYQENGKALGMEFKTVCGNFSGSTDFGNVSFVVPGIHPFFSIGSDALNHTEEYTTAAGSEQAQPHTLRVAKALARTAVDVLLRPGLLQQVKEEFTKRKQEQRSQSLDKGPAMA